MVSFKQKHNSKLLRHVFRPCLRDLSSNFGIISAIDKFKFKVKQESLRVRGTLNESCCARIRTYKKTNFTVLSLYRMDDILYVQVHFSIDWVIFCMCRCISLSLCVQLGHGTWDMVVKTVVKVLLKENKLHCPYIFSIEWVIFSIEWVIFSIEGVEG